MSDARKAAHEALVAKVACIFAGNVTKRQWDANPDMRGDNLDYARAAIAAVYAAVWEATPKMADAWADAPIPPVYSEGMSDDTVNLIHAKANWQAMLAASALNPGCE